MSPSYAPNETVSLLADDYGDMFSMDKLIEFGGISDFRTSGLRSSGRIRAQANADATQMERAMMIAQRRDEFLAQGYQFGGALDQAMVLPPPGGSAVIYGYWMQPSADGRSGFLQPGWLAAY
jgi:hypothetical protein